MMVVASFLVAPVPTGADGPGDAAKEEEAYPPQRSLFTYGSLRVGWL